MSFREYQKSIKRKKEETQTLRMLEHTVSTFSKRKEEYLLSAKEALKRGDQAAYNSARTMLKNVMFQLSEAQDMLVNFKTARDMREFNSMSAAFVRTMDKITLSLKNSSREISVGKSKLGMQKALYDHGKSAKKLQELLSDNGIAFSKTVDSVSDVTDEEIYSALQGVINAEDREAEAMLDELEALYKSDAAESITDESGESSKTEPAKITVSGEDQIKNASPKSEEKSPKKETIVSDSDKKRESSPKKSPEEAVLSSSPTKGEFTFDWDHLPNITFDDVAGLEDVKETVFRKVLLPLKNPEAFEGYSTKNGGGLLLYGPPGTGKTMIAAAIANEIGAKFCSVQPSDLLQTGFGQSEKAVRALFEEARQFPCAVIYFDEFDSLTTKNTRSQYTKNLRSELLAQINGMDSYRKDDNKILFLIGATNRPWDIESAFTRYGRFGTRVYVGLPDEKSRRYMIERRLSKLKSKEIVKISDDINVDEIVKRTEGFNGADIDNLFNTTEEMSAARSVNTGEKRIDKADIDLMLEKISSSVQREDLEKLLAWRAQNGDKQ